MCTGPSRTSKSAAPHGYPAGSRVVAARRASPLDSALRVARETTVGHRQLHPDVSHMRRPPSVPPEGVLVRGMGPELTSAAKSGDAATDECVGLFTPDKKRGTADGAGRAAFD